MLLIYQLKDGRKREAQYQDTIERLSKGLTDLAKSWERTRHDIEEIGRGIEDINKELRKERAKQARAKKATESKKKKETEE